MNNAANNIDATSKSLRALLKERRYRVGYFQREYKWQKIHIEDLLDDLERSFFANFDLDHNQEAVADYDCYYMGPIVLFREGSSFSIVDGQQRLTSFTLLIIYLNNLQKTVYKAHPKRVQKLDEYIFSQNFGSENYNLDVPERKTILDKLFRNLEVTEDDINLESSDNIFERYKDIEQLFPERVKREEVLALFINWITEKLVFIEIVAQTSESAYTIFETMNDRGLNLTPSEMLKSYLLASVKNDEKIKELDSIWKYQIGLLKQFSYDEDQDFFRAWLRAKYAETIRATQQGAENEDFEKIGTRFHTWVKENNRKLLLKTPEDFYYLVQSDFQFFSELFIRISDLETNHDLPEHVLKIMFYKGVSSSLAYPLIIAPIEKIDEEEIVKEKIDLVVTYLDCFGLYRLMLNLPITQSSIRNHIYSMIKEVRNLNLEKLRSKLTIDVHELKKQFLASTNYIYFDRSYGKYLLARIYKLFNPNIPFEDMYFQRKKDSYLLYQFLTFNDVELEVNKIPKSLKEIFINSLCSYCIIPRHLISEFNSFPIGKRIKKLIEGKYLLEFDDATEFDETNLKEFFMNRNKKLKDLISAKWVV